MSAHPFLLFRRKLEVLDHDPADFLSRPKLSVAGVAADVCPPPGLVMMVSGGSDALLPRSSSSVSSIAGDGSLDSWIELLNTAP